MASVQRRVLVVGGYGAFGARIAARLAGEEIELMIAGRSLAQAQQAADALARSSRAKVVPVGVDARQLALDQLTTFQPLVLINASGPYQQQDYRLARACIAAGVHYIDLADARPFVTGIGSLDEAAREREVLVVSGASTVPALSGAVLDAYAAEFAALETVRIVIAPGNRFDPGLATTESILGSLGRPLPRHGNDGPLSHGWQPLRRCALPGLGWRWTGAVDVPDLELVPQRHPSVRAIEVLAGLEVSAFHVGLWGASWLVRAGIIRRPEKLARPLLAVKRSLRRLGSDTGGMMVTMTGAGHNGWPKQVTWHLVARSGDGPYIPATPAVILTKRLLAGTLPQRGATPAVGFFTLADFRAEVADLAIETGAA